MDKVRSLPGERDQNFLLSADDGAHYVLKISNAAEDPQRLDFQHQALVHLANGVELVRDYEQLTPADREASYIAERMKDHDILIGTDGPLHNVLKIKPPLVFTKDNADRLIATLDRVLDEDVVRYKLCC